jgi:vitamin B12 transporter
MNVKSKSALSLALLGAVTLLVPTAGAQERIPVLDEVVVTATRTETPVSELGVSATVIGEQEIEGRLATDVVELLRDVAGLDVVQSGSRGGVVELYSRGGESNFTLVLIDGVKVNEPGGGFDFSTLTTDNIERIEVIRGPQSALYGSDAMGGVIHIITKRGKGEPTATLSTAHGAHSENGRYMGEQKAGFSGSTNWAGYSFSYGRVDDRGILDVNNDFWNNSFSGRLDLYPLDTLEITLTGRMNQSRFGFPTENGGDRPDRVFPGLDPDQFQEKQDLILGMGARLDLFPWWEHSVHLGIHQVDQEFQDDPNAASAFDAPPGSRTRSMENRTTFDYHMNLRWPRQGAVRSTLTLGYAYDLERLDLDSLSTFRFGPLPFGVFTTTSFTEASRDNHAWYVQDQLTLWDRLHLTGGLRVEDNSAFGVDVNPRASIAYELRETGTKLRGAVGTGIKEPTFLENFGGFGTVGNPDLQPERVFSWELGLDQRLWGDRVLLGFTYFRNRYEDLIAFVPTSFPPPPVLPPNYFNVQEAESWGLEFTARVRPGGGFTLGGSYTFLDTQVLDDGGLGNLFFAKGEKLLRRPNHSGSLFVDWSWRGLNVRLDGRYTGKRDDTFFTVSPGAFGFYNFLNQRLTNDDFFVLDLAASYSFEVQWGLLKAIKLFVKARNILDEDYQEVMGYSSPRAAVLGGMALTF